MNFIIFSFYKASTLVHIIAINGLILHLIVQYELINRTRIASHHYRTNPSDSCVESVVCSSLPPLFLDPRLPSTAAFVLNRLQYRVCSLPSTVITTVTAALKWTRGKGIFVKAIVVIFHLGETAMSLIMIFHIVVRLLRL